MIKKGVVITDNEQAFTEKILLIKHAKEQIDFAYYIYKDDYSSNCLILFSGELFVADFLLPALAVKQCNTSSVDYKGSTLVLRKH